jgi:23S rRNA pseudouridine2605 synthase
MNPKYEKIKTYRAYVTGVISREKLAKLQKGVDIGGYITSPAEVRVVRQGERSAIVEIAIREGKNRQVRKMLAAIGCRVMELERIAIGQVRLGRLKPGHFRKMTRLEIELLTGE